MVHEKWFNGEFYYAPRIDGYCSDIYKGNTLRITVLMYSESSIGTLCVDVIEDKLIIGFAVKEFHSTFGCFRIDNPQYKITKNFNKVTSYCTGIYELEKVK